MRYSQGMKRKMDKNNQIAIAGILIILLGVVSAAFFYTQSKAEVKKINSLKKEIAVIAEERMALLEKLEETKVKKKELAFNLQDYSSKIQNDEAEIDSIKKVKEDILAQFQEKRKALSKLQKALEDVKFEESVLKGNLSNAKESHEDVLQSLEDMREKKSMLEERIKSYLEVSKGVELRRIVVKVADPIDGNIIDINKEYNFAVIDLGSMDNMRSGDVLGIYRNFTLVAKAIVENVYEDMSSIIVFDEWRNAEIFYGDIVKLLKN